MKKISKKELKELNDYVKAINEAQATIGALEMQKQKAVREAEMLIERLKSVRKALEEKHGDITVNLTTGEITDADNQKD
jgi:hypothetical protein